MKHYLSFGGGVNSVALHLLMLKESFDFESIFVNHGTDWPETYEYFEMFQDWLVKNGHRQITVLKPSVQGVENLYNHCWKFEMVPSMMHRYCTDKFKVRPVNKYIKKPCFMHIGIDAGESKRAKINVNKEIEHRWLLIEYEIDREGCKHIIREAGLPVPMKSGCYICPYQRIGQWRELRITHPCLFRKAVDLEERNMKYRKRIGKKPLTLRNNGKPLITINDEDQYRLFEVDDLPPCQCAL